MAFDREQYLKDRGYKRALIAIQEEADEEFHKRRALEHKHESFKIEMGILAVFGVFPMLTIVGIPFGLVTFALYGIWKFLLHGHD